MGRVIPFRSPTTDGWLSPPESAPPPPRSAAPANPYAPPPSTSARLRAPRVAVQPRWRRRALLAAVPLLAAGLAAAVAIHAHLLPWQAPPNPPATTSTHAGSTPAAEPLTWTTRQGVAFPVSAASGPLRRDGGLATGFAHDDLGAAIAAAWITYQASPSPGPAVYRAALTQQVTGPAAQALAATVTADYDSARQVSHLPGGAPLGNGTTTFTGYHVTALPGGNRHVTVYERAPDANGVDQVFTLDVVLTWSGGDWRVVAPASGDWSSAFAELAGSPPGVTAFAPAAPSPAGAS